MLSDVFGKGYVVRVVDYILDLHAEYTPSTIAKAIYMDEERVKEILNKLKGFGFVKSEGLKYTTNFDSEAFKYLLKFDFEITKYFATKEFEGEEEIKC